MSSREFLALLRALNPEISVREGWDSELPRYCSLLLDNDTEFVAAQCRGGHVISIVQKQSVQSVVADLSREGASSIVSALRASTRGTDASTGAADRTNRTNRGATINSDPLSSLRANDHNTNGLNAPSRQGRDPNAPPGFEDEHSLVHPGDRGPRIEFDPDQDLYPPGGAYPRLDPLGPNPLRDPLSSGRFPGPGSGMHPSLGGRRNPAARYDPTSPFDPSSQFGGQLGGGSFDSPFGGDGML